MTATAVSPASVIEPTAVPSFKALSLSVSVVIVIVVAVVILVIDIYTPIPTWARPLYIISLIRLTDGCFT